MKIRELIFVITEGQNGTLTAIENNIGVVVFGEDIDDIRTGILFEVEEYFKGDFKGKIRVRRFQDSVIIR